MFTFRKPVVDSPATQHNGNPCKRLSNLEAAPVETEQTTELTRILVGQIAETERKSAQKEAGRSRFSSPFGLSSVQLLNVEVPQC